LLWSWLENPLGVVVVVPMTVWRDKEEWWEVLLGDRVPGLKIGEFEGVIFNDAPGPASLLFALRGAVVAMSLGAEVGVSRSPVRAGYFHVRM
jgi:hypothetical protein